MHKEETKFKSPVRQGKDISNAEVIELPGKECSTGNNSIENKRRTEVLEASQTQFDEKEHVASHETILSDFEKVKVSSKASGAWAAGPPSSMLRETGPSQKLQSTGGVPSPKKAEGLNSVDKEHIEFPESAGDKNQAAVQKPENGKLKKDREGRPNPGPRSPSSSRGFAPDNSSSVQNGRNFGHNGICQDSSPFAWTRFSGAFPPAYSTWPGVPLLTPSFFMKEGGTSSFPRPSQDVSHSERDRSYNEVSDSTMIRLQNGCEYPGLPPSSPNGMYAFYYPFHLYPPTPMPVQHPFMPSWFSYMNAAATARNRGSFNGYYTVAVPSTVDSEQSDCDQKKESPKGSSSSKKTKQSNAEHRVQDKNSGVDITNRTRAKSKEAVDSIASSSQSPAEAPNMLMRTKEEGKMRAAHMAQPYPAEGNSGVEDKNQAMAAFYSPWPMMNPPWFWFPDLRNFDPHQFFTDTALYVYQRIKPTMEESVRKASLFRHLFKLCQNEWKNCDLWMFGSSINSFGLRSGDLDMCLTVPARDAIHRVTGELLEERHIVNRLGVILRQAKMENVECRIRARVPIVKFHDPLTNLSVDVCINNKLARHNSALLRTYASLDPRVQILGLLIKYWAKCRGINQPFTGTLSSYAYILLLVQYLQIRKRPLLPCLQLSVGGNLLVNEADVPQVMVDNCNVYFDTCVTSYLTASTNSNTDSIGLLLTEFFEFYAHYFDYSKYVVSIRKGHLLSREEKDWFVPPLDARVEESEDEDNHISEDIHNDASFSHALETNGGHSLDDMDSQHDSNNTTKDSRKGIPSEVVERSPVDLEIISPKVPFTNVSRGGKRHKRYKELHVFCVEDPFDVSHDIGRVVDEETLKVLQDEFIRAYEIIRSTGNFLEVCRPYEGEHVARNDR